MSRSQVSLRGRAHGRRRVQPLRQDEDAHGPTSSPLLSLQQAAGNHAVGRLLDGYRPVAARAPTPLMRSSMGVMVNRKASGDLWPWQDVKSSSWALRALASFGLAAGLGRLHIDFELKNMRSGRVFPAYFEGQVAGVAAGLDMSMDPSWTRFGTAGAVRPDGLSGLASNVRSAGISIGIIGASVASIRLPNQDTAPARIPIGGISGSFGIKAGVFYAGGEFRVGKSSGPPVA